MSSELKTEVRRALFVYSGKLLAAADGRAAVIPLNSGGSLTSPPLHLIQAAYLRSDG
jgi:hypothetical protein